MRGIKSFAYGFSLSLISVSLGGQLYSLSLPAQKITPPQQNISIDLYKEINAIQTSSIKTVQLFPEIKKQTLSKTDNDSIGTLPSDESISIEAFNAPEDDEILSINIDGLIPIDFEDITASSQSADIANTEDAEISAMLPNNILQDNLPALSLKASTEKSPFIEDDIIDLSLYSAPLPDTTFQNSYKVAEKVKSSLIFPIPDEILSDENLTPTFINTHKKIKPKKNKPANESPLKITPKVSTEKQNKEAETKGILENISSWFSPQESKERETKAQTPPPSYGSQGETAQAASLQPDNTQGFVDLYKAMQEARQESTNGKILPSELKLSFQPGRAEISGQTLDWLKAFSEHTKNNDVYLQIRLDANAPAELQKKRLNLLYTIFMNNGVDPEKIDTTLSLSEPNTFIIRALKIK